jgi:hypothetical protein
VLSHFSTYCCVKVVLLVLEGGVYVFKQGALVFHVAYQR